MLAWLTASRSLPSGVDPDRLTPLLPTPYLRARWGLTPPATALIRALTGHTSTVTAVAWSPDSTQLASASHDGTVRLWDPATGTLQSTLTDHTSTVTAVAWSPHGTQLASTSGTGTIWVFDLDCPRRLTYLQVEPLTCLQWADAGIAVSGPQGAGVFDLTCT